MPHDNKIDLFSAIGCACPSPNTIIKYSMIPIMTECNNIDSPRSMFLPYRNNKSSVNKDL